MSAVLSTTPLDPMHPDAEAAPRSWGGFRPGAGRKPGPLAKSQHIERPPHSGHAPVRVTVRRADGLPSFRDERLHDVLKKGIRDTLLDDFRIVHYSLQADHIHLIVEADSEAALTKGMRSFTVRVAVLVNYRLNGRRSGKVWSDRYHCSDLTTPKAVRAALVHLLTNQARHGETEADLVDPYSSGPWFEGLSGQSLPLEPSPVQPARTWLLQKGWLQPVS